MADDHPFVALARDLARLSRALAETLEAGDVDGAERLLAERGVVLEMARTTPVPRLPADLAALAQVRTLVAEADARSTAAARRGLEAVQAELAGLTTGARAVRAYLGGDPPAPGWIDRHD